MTKTNVQTNHHGNLRESLIHSGIALLEEGGVSALTLRKCAARSGVSHAAPAHHFDGLQGLIEAICHQGLAMFAKAMQDKIDQAEAKPFPRLYAMCEGYYQFFVEHPALANLMFNQEHKTSNPPHESRSDNAAFNILVSTCAPFKHGPKGHRATEYAVWSLIQGYSHLAMMGQFGCDADQPPINFADLLGVLNLELDD